MDPLKSGRERKVHLVTGATGFLGKTLVHSLAKRFPEDDIFATTRTLSDTPDPIPGVHWVKGDLRDRRVWKKVPDTITHVFHLAAHIPYAREERNDSKILRDNLEPVLNLIEQSWCWKHLRHVVYISSISVYGNSVQCKTENASVRPSGLYGFAKWMGEELLKVLGQRGVRIACLRLSSLYGPGQYPGTVLPRMLQDARDKGRILVFGRGKRVQDFLHVEDAARALIEASEKNGSGVFNVGCGRSVSMLKLGQVIRRTVGKGVKLQYMPLQEERDPGNKISIRRAQKELGFVPKVPLEEGLHRLIANGGMGA